MDDLLKLIHLALTIIAVLGSIYLIWEDFTWFNKALKNKKPFITVNKDTGEKKLWRWNDKFQCHLPED